MEAPPPQTPGCRKCNSLQRQYQRSVREISSVVKRRFSVLGEKLRELHKWQDIRDKAVSAMNEHRKSHIAGQHDVLGTTTEEDASD